MQKPTFDPGLTQQVGGKLRRALEKNGQFNVHRKGTTWRDVHPYLHLISMPWPGFLGVLFSGFLILNTLFTVGYYLLGANELHNEAAVEALGGRFMNDFFFSAQTLTTVGYGHVWPQGF